MESDENTLLLLRSTFRAEMGNFVLIAAEKVVTRGFAIRPAKFLNGLSERLAGYKLGTTKRGEITLLVP